MVKLVLLLIADGHDLIGDLAEEDKHDGVGEDEEDEGVEGEDDYDLLPET